MPALSAHVPGPAAIPLAAIPLAAIPERVRLSVSANLPVGAPRVPRAQSTAATLLPSLRFKVRQDGRISNHAAFLGTFQSFWNDPNGDCLFASFKQSLGPNCSDSMQTMRSKVVDFVQRLPDAEKINAVAAHIMREMEYRNKRYDMFKAKNAMLDAENPAKTLASPYFTTGWDLYSRDMKGTGWAGGHEAIALGNLYSVNVAVWTLASDRAKTASFLDHLNLTVDPHSSRTVHLLNIGNRHYEATSLPQHTYPVTVHASEAAGGESGGVQQDSHIGAESANAQLPNINIAAPQLDISMVSRLSESLSMNDDSIDNCSASSTVQLNQDINEYCGLLLNRKEYLVSIEQGIKIFEMRTVNREALPPKVVFHPSKKLWNTPESEGGYSKNIEAFLGTPTAALTSAQGILDRTRNGQDVGMSEIQVRQWFEALKQRRSISTR